MRNNGFIYHDINNSEEIYSWKHLLSNYSLEKINSYFENYKTSCLYYSTNFSRIEQAVKSLFTIEVQGHEFSPNFKNSIFPEKRTSNMPYYFFRIRKIEKDTNINNLQDIWERPSNQITNFQRLSKPKHSVLYTSLMPSTAMLETNIQKDDTFILIVYKSIKTFCYSDCCSFLYYNELTEEENMKRYIMFQLLRNEFTRILPSSYNGENQYCAAYNISNKFFIAEDACAIQYPSTRGLGHKNFAFLNNIKENLEFIGFRVCYLEEKIETLHNCKIITDGFWDNEQKQFIYFTPNSEKSKSIFENFYLKTMMSK